MEVGVDGAAGDAAVVVAEEAEPAEVTGAVGGGTERFRVSH